MNSCEAQQEKSFQLSELSEYPKIFRESIQNCMIANEAEIVDILQSDFSKLKQQHPPKNYTAILKNAFGIVNLIRYTSFFYHESVELFTTDSIELQKIICLAKSHKNK